MDREAVEFMEIGLVFQGLRGILDPINLSIS